MSYINIKGIEKWFSNRIILKNVSLQIPKEKILVILGASGSGKTTLLNLLAGFISPEKGSIEFDKRLVTSPNFLLPASERQLGYVFQDLALWPNMTVKEHIAFVMRVKPPRSRENHDNQVNYILKKMHLDILKDSYPHQLSGGEAQRLALARCLVLDPPILLLDEILVNIDSHNKYALLNMIKNLKKTIIYVTHNQEEAFFLADLLAILEDGEIKQYGETFKVYNNPISLEVAKITGKFNLVKASYFSEDDLYLYLKNEELIIPVEKRSKFKFTDKNDISVIIRPNNIKLTPDQNGNTLIHSKIFLGNYYLYSIKLNKLELLVTTTTNFSDSLKLVV